MIAMLRRRLMSNMAKAKNIATGTVSTEIISGSPTRVVLKTSGLGFTPNRVVCVRTASSNVAILGIWDATGYNQSVAVSLSLSFDTDGFELSLVKSGPSSTLNGTYNFVAWQE